MEIDKQLDRKWYVDHAYLRGIQPDNEYLFLVNYHRGGEYELSVSIEDVKNNTPDFQIMPSMSATAKECVHDFATIHWQFLKECVLIMEQCMFYDTAKSTLDKSRKWDEYVATNKKKDTGKNRHIKIFEFLLPNGVLQWVAAESVWKAALWFMSEYEIFSMEDEIEDIVELPKAKWGEYLLFESDGRQVPFDKIIKRRKVFPQTIAVTEEFGRIINHSSAENTPLTSTAKDIISSK